MVVGKVLIALLGASLLVVSRQERLWVQRSSVLWRGRVGLKTGKVLRDRLKNEIILDIYLSAQDIAMAH